MKEPINVLLVDDNKDLLDNISDYLTLDNYTFKIAETVSGARTVLNEFDVDVVVSDLNLPDGFGTDLLLELRQNGLSTPMVIMSGDVSSDKINEMLFLGAFDFYEKPIDIDSLLKSITFGISQGISTRRVLSKLSEVLNEHDLKSVSAHLGNTSRSRALNFKEKKKAG